LLLAGDEGSSGVPLFIDFGMRLCENPRQQGINQVVRAQELPIFFHRGRAPFEMELSLHWHVASRIELLGYEAEPV
jgi:hypothetical protein